MKQLILEAAGPYSLKASIRFLEGFTPATYQNEIADHLHLAFTVDDGEDIAGVCVRGQDQHILVDLYGNADPEAVRQQVTRILSLDVDGRGWPLVGDPVMKNLQERFPGLRPVCFYSPYEAAAWALISHRIRIAQAAKIKAQMARDLGSSVDIHGHIEYAFPAPSRLLTLDRFPGLTERKIAYLQQLARATIEGKLNAHFLRSLPSEQALEHLKQLPGIGDFSAQLVLLRGAGEPDFLPTNEPRLARAFALAYGENAQAIEQVAEAWRPYRTWGTFLLRVFLEETTHEIAQGHEESHRK
uniref:DNA-3-methyladenine glycosylase II n=1 Tax=Thermosporothrix sp. COM3 TaxID=2490863 RepID=A0A455SKI4_9CHLR|nr:DNA-3-methyladenine glycosylase II [Thermosporothrix sp. COM3]